MKRRVVLASFLALTLTVLATSRSAAEESLPGAGEVRLAGAGEVRLEPVSAEQVGREADRTLLQVNNQTPFIVFVYVGGVRIGWMRPYRTAVIRGLNTGYHKLYAHSQYGTTSWGPREAWIPGSWNLIY